MTAVPPSGGPTGSSGPIKPSGAGPTQPSDDAKYAQYLQSPFAKMFEKTGAKPTGKEMKEIIDNILKTVIDQAKKQEAQMKKALKKLGREERGEDT